MGHWCTEVFTIPFFNGLTTQDTIVNGLNKVTLDVLIVV